MAANNDYVYFYYSDEQLKEKNNILARSGKEVIPGFVIVNGKRKSITAIVSDKNIMSRYIDAELVAEGEKNNFTFQRPMNNIKAKRGR